MNDWTQDEWVNLEQSAARLQQLLKTRKRDEDNPAWQTKLRIVLQTLAMYQ